MEYTVKEIAEICGVSEQSIRKWCAKHEVSQVAKQWKPNETDAEAIFRHYGIDVSQVAKSTKPGSFAGCETGETCAKPSTEPSEPVKTVPWEVYEGLCRRFEVLEGQLATKDGQIADLSAALVAAQETAKAAQALHAAEKAEAMAIESADMKKGRWQRLKDAWRGGGTR